MNLEERLVVEGTDDLARVRSRATEVAVDAIGPERAPDVALVTSELVTNALEHGSRPPVDVVITVDEQALNIDVSSPSGDLPIPSPVTAEATDVRGRGLQIVVSLSDDVVIGGADGRIAVAASFNRT